MVKGPAGWGRTRSVKGVDETGGGWWRGSRGGCRSGFSSGRRGCCRVAGPGRGGGRGRTAVKRHLITDGAGTPLAAKLSAANINDYGFLLPLLDAASKLLGERARLVLGDRGYDSRAVRAGVSERGHQPAISQRNKPGQGRRRDERARQRQPIERTFAWLSAMRRLATRWERRDELYLAFLTLGCAVICSRTLER